MLLPDASVQHGRVIIRDSPSASPGSCGICGYAGQDRQYIDWRIDFEFYGTFIFCTVCYAEPMRLLGWVESDKALALAADLNSAIVYMADLEAHNRELEAQIDVLAAKRVGTSRPIFADHSDILVSDVESVKSDDKRPAAAVEGTAETNSGTTVNADEPRSHDPLSPDLSDFLSL